MLSRSDYRLLRDIYNTPQTGPQRLQATMQEAFRNGEWSHVDFSIRDLAEETVDDGHEWVAAMKPGKGQVLYEAGQVNSGAFSNITGQIYYNAVLEAYQDEDFKFS